MTDHDPGMEGNTVLDEPTAEQRIEALQFEIAALREANQRMDRTSTDLRNANTHLKQHLAGLGEALRAEAIRREWCEEYDTFAEEWDLPKRYLEFEVTMTVKVTATDEESALEMVKENVHLSSYSTEGVIEGPSFEASEA
jgi:FtsZ-binding cell division protein ZapB